MKSSLHSLHILLLPNMVSYFLLLTLLPVNNNADSINGFNLIGIFNNSYILISIQTTLHNRQILLGQERYQISVKRVPVEAGGFFL